MSTARAIAGILVYVGLFAALLFVPAGTLDWRRAWVLLGVLLVMRAVGTVGAIRVNPELLAERSGLPLHRGQPVADRVLLLSFMASFAALIAFCAVDAFHLRLLPRAAAGVSFAGLVLFAGGWWIIAQVLRTNAFAVRVVRHQQERRHTLVDTGVYAVVRHPMYAGIIPVLIGMCLWLESYAGALLALVPIGILAGRIVLEERFLRRTLAGYEAYAGRVRWRLIPGVW
ncbi:MAG TPA: isoprenylcysteine carboxylmethyltransferase family protein [Longimicrobium sp.]|jgi:protein-S-isoprenylcysteine O-methyltransferase Ste14|nr:isoprenylcysteine carboxylmethyltransferase family protein [Longimicrobium sp.]